MAAKPFKLRYHPDVKSIDIPLIDTKNRARIKRAIEERLATAPHQYGEPLRKTLKGFWKLRVGDFRVVYQISAQEVRILGIINRRDVYKRIGKRT